MSEIKKPNKDDFEKLLKEVDESKEDINWTAFQISQTLIKEEEIEEQLKNARKQYKILKKK
jgi:hypothetical protein